METISQDDLAQIHSAIDNLMNAMTDEGTQNVGIQIIRVKENGEQSVSNYTVSVNLQFTPKPEQPLSEEQEQPEESTPEQPEESTSEEPENNTEENS